MSELNHNLALAVSGFSGKRVLVLGDLMLDHYLFGDAERVSPEAPVPVVLVSQEKLLLGGAGNVVNNVLALGGAPRLVSLSGEDAQAKDLLGLLDSLGIERDLIVDPTRPTTIKTRIVARSQQMLRVDFEKKHPMDGPLLAVLREVLERSRAEKFAVVVLSDYGKGFFSPESMLALREVLGSGPGAPLLLVDPKTSNYHLYHGVELLTPNRKEAAEAAELPPASTREEIISTGHKIFRKLGVKRLVITLGADGMAVFERPGKVWHVPNLARKIFDVTGAGDTVIATLALGLASGLELLEACILANHAAGIVVGKVGAATTSPKELREALASAPPLEAKLWLDV